MKIFADFEYNGQPELEIIQFGAVLTDDECTVISKFNKYVKPGMPITSYVENLTSITNDMIQNQHRFNHVFKEFTDWLSPCPSIMFYAWGKDWRQLRRECERTGCLSMFDNLMKGNRRINYQREFSIKTLYEGKLMTKALKLEDAKKLYSLNDAVQHDALSDAYDVYRIYRCADVDCIKYDEQELKRIFVEKKNHMKHMEESKEKQLRYLFKDIIPAYHNKKIIVDNILFRKFKSGPVDIFQTIAACFKDTSRFSKQCAYRENSVSFTVIEFIPMENSLCMKCILAYNNHTISNLDFMIRIENMKFWSRILKSQL